MYRNPIHHRRGRAHCSTVWLWLCCRRRRMLSASAPIPYLAVANKNKQQATRHSERDNTGQRELYCTHQSNASLRCRPRHSLLPTDKDLRSSTWMNISQPPSPPPHPTSTLFSRPSRTCTHASTHATHFRPPTSPRFPQCGGVRF